MLFKKTLKVASATTLWMVALLGAHSAMALNFDEPQTATSNSPLVYSAEGLMPKAPTDVGYSIDHASDLTAVGTMGTLAGILARSSDVYVRVDVGGVLALRDQPTLTVAGDSDNAISTETNPPDEQFLLYVIAADSSLSGATSLEVDFTGDLAVTDLGNGTVMMRGYDSVTGALHGEGATLFSKELTLVTVASSVTVSGLPVSRTATVASGFTQFAAASPVSLAGFEVQVSDTHLDAAGTALAGTLVSVDVQPSSVEGGSNVMIAGDGGFGFASSVVLDSMADCSAGDGAADAIGFPLDDDGEPIKTGPLTAALADGPWYVCVTVDGAPQPNTEVIPEGTYTVDINLVGRSEGRPFPPQGAEGLASGTVEHDGTTVHIPFVTSYDGYTQRIVIVNRNRDDVSFTVTFHTEGDGTADPTWYDGMAAGGQATVVKVADIVTLENPTRASATVTIVSTPAMVDVATTMVNKMDESTDTVVLHRGRHDD